MAKNQKGYATLQIALHWAVAIVIAAAWFTGEGMGRALRQRIQSGTTGFEGNTWHVWLGGIVFALVLIRIIVRLLKGAPDPLPAPAWQEKLATWGHRILYVLMVLSPLLGAIAWYGHNKFIGEIHPLSVNLLVIVVFGHAAAALYHHYVLKDGTLRRMIRPE